MSLKNTDEQFGFAAKSFHWVIGLLIIGLLCVGFYMTYLLESGPDKWFVYGWHKQLGILVLALVVLRIVWRFINPVPKMMGTPKRWEILASRLTHLSLYICMALMPLSGWLMSSAGGHPVNFFGVTVPALIEKNKALGAIFREAHFVIAIALLALISLHLAAAIRHHFILKDGTLVRMLPDCPKKDK